MPKGYFALAALVLVAIAGSGLAGRANDDPLREGNEVAHHQGEVALMPPPISDSGDTWWEVSPTVTVKSGGACWQATFYLTGQGRQANIQPAGFAMESGRAMALFRVTASGQVYRDFAWATSGGFEKTECLEEEAFWYVLSSGTLHTPGHSFVEVASN